MKYHEVEPKNNMDVRPPSDALASVEVEVARTRKSVVVGEAVKQKKGLGRRLMGGLFGPGGVKKIARYVAIDIIWPALKNLAAESMHASVDMAFGFENRPYRGGGKPAPYNADSPKTDYRNAGKTGQPAQVANVRLAEYVDDFIIGDRYEAAEVLVNLKEAADKYGSASVADYYEMLGVATRHTDGNYGWTIDTIGKSTIMPTRGGYIIKFPPMEVI